MTLLIYQDYIHNNGLLHKRLSALYGPESVRFCDACDIQNGCLDPETVDLFIMPGGADLYYCEKLDGAGTRAIRQYVESGGRYLGICAGAYFACRDIEWAKGIKDHEICGPRPLKFSKSTAAGPVDTLIEDGDINKSWNGVAHILTAKGDTVPLLYTGGPVFTKAPGNEVIARYAALPGHPPAIIKCAVGQGTAVLCAPHIESLPSEQRGALYTHLNPSHNWDQSVIETLAPHEEKIQSLQRNIFDMALGRQEHLHIPLRQQA